MSKFNTAIVGYGYVGQATHKLINDVDTIIDINSTDSDWNKAQEADIVFICVPTPQDKTGAADVSLVKGVIEKLGTKPLYVIRSTVPWTFEMQGYNLIANPEFLNQNEFLEPLHCKQLLGGTYNLLQPLIELYSQRGIVCKLTTWTNAWQTKYASNLYGAFKVSFWEMIQDITGNERLVYSTWADLGINQGDMAQVGMDGKRGFSGACFPKDTNAILALTNHKLLRSVIEYNNGIRDE